MTQSKSLFVRRIQETPPSSRSAEMDKLGSMLEKKWEKVKPRCTSLKMTGIKAGYGVSKKKELEDTVVCDDGGTPESKDQE